MVRIVLKNNRGIIVGMEGIKCREIAMGSGRINNPTRDETDWKMRDKRIKVMEGESRTTTTIKKIYHSKETNLIIITMPINAIRILKDSRKKKREKMRQINSKLIKKGMSSVLNNQKGPKIFRNLSEMEQINHPTRIKGDIKMKQEIKMFRRGEMMVEKDRGKRIEGGIIGRGEKVDKKEIMVGKEEIQERDNKDKKKDKHLIINVILQRRETHMVWVIFQFQTMAHNS